MYISPLVCVNETRSGMHCRVCIAIYHYTKRNRIDLFLIYLFEIIPLLPPAKDYITELIDLYGLSEFFVKFSPS